MPASKGFVAWLFAWVVTMPWIVHGYRGSFNLTISSKTRMTKITPFYGTERNGNASISVQIGGVGRPRKPPSEYVNMYLAVFNAKQWIDYDLSSYGSGSDEGSPCSTDDTHQCIQLCSLPSVKRFQVWGDPYKRNTGRQFYSFPLTERTEYTIVLFSCSSQAQTELVNVVMDVVLLNPDGKHLSIERAPLEMIYLLDLICYAMLTFLCIVQRFSVYKGVRLHTIFVVTLCMKLFQVIFEMVYYRKMSTTGIDDVALLDATRMCDIMTNAVFLALLLLISLGWTITRDRLTKREKQLFWVFFSMYGVFGLMHSICNDPNYCQSFLLAFYVVKFLITFCIIVALNANLERLRAGTLELSRPLTPTQLYCKILIFYNVRWTFLAILVFPIALMFVEVAVLTWEQAWIGILLQEILYLSVFVSQPPAVQDPPGISQDNSGGQPEDQAGNQANGAEQQQTSPRANE
uniref:GOST seven transmembrane domain-containing protein n=1 Tax=Guillardia theta TaxID=55529 RepID=A0A7S4PFB1_GUITH|mmetsp:Transcript_49734/g.155633  ORF Transcript_49734/g.155633 Transcript_49734/m.155633 type:complete len:461 (+) Transcript_49734:255-1637(+)